MNSQPDARPLPTLLKEAFGFASFRANQEAVCRAAIQGRDVLLVMPTGSGKSLCYQLPAIARGGTALVVSPLIALMDDQTAKLTAIGFPVARIHSGMARSEARQVCIDYLKGNLRFLFIAPERLRVPGFPEMLAKRKPSLIAIDEAHCISQWGHDFRPDYRMLGGHLKSLRPAPVIALTATATPRVQRDIIVQLELEQPSQFIHGFRRDNLTIEVVSVPLPQRSGIACGILRDPLRLPAIVYMPTRKHADALAAEIARDIPAAAYHAGLDSDIRERVQEQFLLGRLEVVVATIAFGMGIDKPNVRTVIHTALPGSLEGYYQEIGRAGRDGQPSRTLLMHSFADQRTHDFFLTRDYPPVDTLAPVFEALGAQFTPREEIQESLHMEAETFDKALEKLMVYGGAEVDYRGDARRGHDRWREPYSAQADHRRTQMELVLRYVNGSQCRMSALVRHFGDFQDGERPCGLCDFCNPHHCLVQQFRSATQEERQIAEEVLETLRSTRSSSTGKLHRQLSLIGGRSRNDFEEILGAMTRAGLVAVEEAEFQKEGKVIPYRKVLLTESGYAFRPGSPLNIELKVETDAAGLGRPRPAASRRKATPVTPPVSVDISPGAQALEDRLRTWRQEEAKKSGMPAYLVLHDRTVRALACARPAQLSHLLAIPGIGPGKIEKYGSALLKICADA